MAQMRRFQLDLDFNPKTCLLADGQLDRVQEILREFAPKWTVNLHLYRYPKDRRPIDVKVPGELAEMVRGAIVREPSFYEQLRQQGSPFVRITGSAEIRGTDTSLLVVVRVDEYPIAPSGEEWIWGNSLWITVSRRRVEGMDAVAWSTRVFEAVCAALSPFHAFASMFEEFDSKNISRAGGGVAAVGRNVAGGLPGLYWLNFFSQPYRDLIGRDRLLSTPAHSVTELAEGVLLMVHSDPQAWDLPDYREAEDRVLAHLGQHYFFSKADPDRETIAPPFDLPPLAPLGRRGPVRVFYPEGNG